MSILWVLLCGAAFAACGRQPSQPPPPSTPPGPGESITGSERIGWDQRATNAAELATFRFAIYVDGTRSELTAATCATEQGNSGFACSARLPQLSAGNHSLELATFVVDGSIIESPRTSPLLVTVRGITSTGSTPPSTTASDTDEAVGSIKPGVVSVSGQNLALALFADGPDRPTDLAFAPDGRLFVADRSGHIRVVRDGLLLDRPALAPDADKGEGAVLALAVDPDFARTHFVYAIAVERAEDDGPSFVVARYREAGDTLADRAILVHSVPAAPQNASASLRFGPDGKLYAAFDDGGEPSNGGDLASSNGKVLRLNRDATTPDDQAGGSPVYAFPYRSPKGIGWNPSTGVLWVLDGGDAVRGSVDAIVDAQGSGKRGVVRVRGALPESTDGAALAVYRDGPIVSLRNSVLVGSARGHHLLKLQLDSADPTRVVATERLLADRVGPMRAVTIGPDGAVYFATDGAIGRLGPESTPAR